MFPHADNCGDHFSVYTLYTDQLFLLLEHKRSLQDLKELHLCVEQERKVVAGALCDLSIVGMT